MDPSNINSILLSKENLEEANRTDDKQVSCETSENDTWITGRESFFDSAENLSFKPLEISESKCGKTDFQDVLAKIRSIRVVLRNVSVVYKITKWDIVTSYIGIFLCTLDIALNFMLFTIYFSMKFNIGGTLTLIVMIIPSILTKLSDRCALWKLVERNVLYWVWIWPYFLFNVDPIYKYHLLLKLTTTFLKNYESFGLEQQKLALKVYNTFMKLSYKTAVSKTTLMKWQTIPLLILHSSILVRNTHRDDLYLMRRFQLLTVITLCVGIVASNLTHYRFHKFISCIRVNFLGGMIFTLGLSIPIICRCIAISSCLSFSLITTCIIITIHCFVTIYWSYTSCGVKDNKIISSLLIGVDLTMIPLFSAPRRALLTNGILLFENFTMLLLWGIPEGSKFSFMLIGYTLSVDIIFRAVHVLYCKYRNNFITTVLL